MRAPVVGLALTLLLAGCFAAEEEAPAQESAPEEAAPQAAPAAEAPNDDGKAEPMPGDVGHSPHMHDYWMGKERVTLFEGTVDPTNNTDPFVVLEPFLVHKEPKVGRTFWQLPDGAIVYEGTGQLDITAIWSDPLVTSLGLEYRPSPGAPLSDALTLPNGETVSIPVTPEMTDMPHMKTSRWVFMFEAGKPPSVLMGPFELKIEIVKVADIMLFPGHPELFEGKPEKVLHDLDHQHEEVSYAKRVPNLATQGEFGEKTVRLADLVPMETLAMRIEVDILDATSTPGVVSDIRFFYHGADTNYLGHPYVLPYEGSLAQKRLVYQIPVAMEQTDSPYAPESQWLFFVEPTSKFVGDENEPDCGGCADVSIKYHLKVIAYDHELDGYSKMEGEE